MKTVIVAIALIASGCSQATIAEINAAFEPIDRAWRQQTNENPFIGLQFAIDGLIAAEQIQMIKQLERELR